MKLSNMQHYKNKIALYSFCVLQRIWFSERERERESEIERESPFKEELVALLNCLSDVR